MRDWWLRTLLVLQRPRPVFVALRDESRESLSDRAEPVLLIVLLAGIAGVLSTRTAGRLLDDSDYDGVLVFFWSFLAGGLVRGLRLLRGRRDPARRREGCSARRARIAARGTCWRSPSVPLALSLVVWPVKLGVFGDDVFRSGGSDSGAGGTVFELIWIGFVLWSAALLVIGVRAVHGWTWARAGAACALAVVAPVVVGLLLSS